MPTCVTEAIIRQMRTPAAVFSHKRFSLSAFVNRNSSSGYDFNKKDTGKTVMPFHNYTAQVKAEQGLGSIVKAGISLRYYNEKQQTLYSTGGGISNWSDSRACKTRDISMWLRRENGLFVQH